MPKKIFTIDCETDPFLFGRIPKPFVWGCFDGCEYYQFSKTEDMACFIRQTDGIFYAHNGGKFDFHFLAEYIERNQRVMMINSRLVKARIGKGEIRDSYALLPFPLSSYKKDDFDYAKMEVENREKHKEEIEKYLKNDCIFLYEIISEFIGAYGKHLTAPGAAIKTLCKMEDIKIPNSGAYFFSEIKKHYFGGRCECIRAGSFDGPLTYLDINSAYPHAMRHQHPAGLDYEVAHDPDPVIIPHNFYVFEGISYGAVCRRTEKGSLIFDNDGKKRVYHTTGHELKAGLDMGRIEIERHIEQKNFGASQTFENFINHFWALRKTTKKGTPQNLFAKLFMNSAYGKFAANPENYDTYVFYDPEISEFLIENEWEIRGEIGGHVLASKPLDPSEMRYYNVATGASITGFVRAMLFRALCSVENPIYCDTDSIIFSGAHNLELSDELGAWKIEGIYDEGHFAGKKLYALKNEKEIKKANKGARLNFNQIKKIASGEEIIYKKDAPVFSWLKETSFLERKIRRTRGP